ncbi:DNA polymerase II [Aliikangiella coralliicola]|uniref:DNA polymerase n=1 Tax=Aliikangiella coralliicola TaxID=2592383 RepID=A0A545UCT9_9GAMM|nr:DNA polymerase II [Aliikangiella coralliicola]TQV87287.1 DNA polymerase II [Aliikangiella coralliicola]
MVTEKGFLLTRNSFDRKGRTEIELWLSTEKGPAKLCLSGERPVFFVEHSQQAVVEELLEPLSTQFEVKALSLKTFSHQAVSGLYFNQLKSFYEARSILNENNIVFYEGGIRLEDRYLMERFVYGGVEFIGDVIDRRGDGCSGYIEYKNVKVKPCEYVPELRVISLDIECSERGELYSIGFYGKKYGADFNRVVMIGEQQPVDEDIDYIKWVENEVALLHVLEEIIGDYDPDIIIGWSVVNFDFRLLIKRAKLHGMQLRLGRNQSYARWRESRTEMNQGFLALDGRVVIDGIAALKAESYFFPSFSLEAMSQHFLGRGKSTEDVDNRMETINHDFKYNKQKLANYNLQDCVLVWDIFKKAKLLEFLIFRSQLTGLELDRAGGSVAAFVNLYLPKLHRQGYVSPNLPDGGGLASPGGYVMNSKPGLYQHVLVLDFKSLYPSIIRTFKIDPLGLVEGLKAPDEAIEGFRGGCFSRDKHLLPDIITELWQQRDQAKKEQDGARSQAIKILMNSFYGVLGSGGCPFYDTRLASSITLRGHAIMQQTAKWIESQGLEVIYGDTDSTFVLLSENVSDQQACEIGRSLAEYINCEWRLKLASEFGIESCLEMEFESHFSRFLMPTIRGSEKGSKKRYAGLIKTGSTEKLVFKGLENVRTDWTVLAKSFQENLYELIFHDRDPQDFIRRVVEQTLNGEKDGELAYRKRLRRRLDSYVKNIPPHVKAARLADEENRKQDKPLRYQGKGWITYVMTVSGPQPVEYISAKIDYQHYIDKQIQPVADAILPFVGLSFSEIVDAQMGLF